MCGEPENCGTTQVSNSLGGPDIVFINTSEKMHFLNFSRRPYVHSMAVKTQISSITLGRDRLSIFAYPSSPSILERHAVLQSNFV